MPAALVGLSQVFTGPVRDGVAALEKTLPLIAERQQSIGAAFARGGLAIGYAILGEFDKAAAAAAMATEIAGRGDLIAQLDALIAESFVQSLKGDLETAVPIAQQCVDQAEETGASACVIVSSWILGDAFLREGRFAEARDVLKRGSDIASIVDRKVWRPTLIAWFGRAAAGLGVEEGDWDEALETARSIGNIAGEAMILAKRAEATAARGDVAGARPHAEAAIALFEELGARPYLARALNAWGIALRNDGQTAESERILRRALALFEELGIEGEAGAVRTLLSLGSAKLTVD
jgi:tetratricopeptide (TPR) repeat protein